MISVNSLSGGKTSSYMAVHYPADYNIFSIVRIEDVKCSPKDSSIVKYVSDKINKDFIATAENDLTLYLMRDLEQKIGSEIVWVTGETFEQIIKRKGKYLPNQLRRYCTTEMKLRPIFDWWMQNIGEKINMSIGYRYDEMERADRFTESFKGITGKRGTRNKWETIQWRKGNFPLIENKIIHPTIIKWANESGLMFPGDSNCVGCFHKPLQQLRKNFDDQSLKMNWFSEIEKTSKSTWKQDGTYYEFSKLPLQMDFNFGVGSGCNGGFCTD